MKYDFTIEDMAIELQGAAQIMTETICGMGADSWRDDCNTLYTIRGLIARIGNELQQIAENNNT